MPLERMSAGLINGISPLKASWSCSCSEWFRSGLHRGRQVTSSANALEYQTAVPASFTDPFGERSPEGVCERGSRFAELFNRDIVVTRCRCRQLSINCQVKDRFSEVGGGDVVDLWKMKLLAGRVGASANRASEARRARPFFLLPQAFAALQPVTQRHQLVHSRHNPLLLGKGRGGGSECSTMPFQTCLRSRRPFESARFHR